MSTYFKEKQKFTQILIWIFLIGFTGWWCYIKYHIFYLKQPFIEIKPTDNIFHIVDLIIGVLLLLFLTANLKTEIRKDGFYYKFFPFQFHFRHINWSDVKKMEIRKYKPISEYLGWGIRFGSKGQAYNVKGNIGLQLVLKNGKQILFGTQQPKDLQKAIDNLKNSQIVELRNTNL
jgi:hypothetical protein